jgi:hypothetical protein
VTPAGLSWLASVSWRALMGPSALEGLEAAQIVAIDRVSGGDSVKERIRARMELSDGDERLVYAGSTCSHRV